MATHVGGAEDTIWVSDLRVTPDGGHVIVGNNNKEGFIARLDVRGDVIWQTSLGSGERIAIYAVQPTVDGHYLAVGESALFDSFGDGAVWKFSSNGDLVLQRTFGGLLSEAFNFIQPTADGGHLIGGRTNSWGAGGNNAWLLKMDRDERMGGCAGERWAIPERRVNTVVVGEGAATSLPRDVVQAFRPAVATRAVPEGWQQCPLPMPSTQLVAVEYYHPAFDHYFVTTSRSEMDALDQGLLAGWQRTGLRFRVSGLDSGASRVCRFWSGQSFAPKSSHFHTPLAAECAIVSRDPSWMYEGDVFATHLPDAVGRCASGATPLYRLYNNGMGGAPNHRYTIYPWLHSLMMDKGWIPEGIGVGIIGCVPAQ